MRLLLRIYQGFEMFEWVFTLQNPFSLMQLYDSGNSN